MNEIKQNSDRFEILHDGESAGYVTYQDAENSRTFIKTYVDDSYRGKGLAEELIRQALDATREAGMDVQPQCTYVKRFIQEHEEYQDLVSASAGR